MPIVIQSVSLESYLLWLSSQNSPPHSPLFLRASYAKQLLTFPTSRRYHTSTPSLSRAELSAKVVTREQHEVIVGSLLADMSAIKPAGPKRNTRLTIGQSKSNLDYLLSLSSLLATLIRQQTLTPDNKLDRNTGIQYYGYKLCTMSLPCLNIYREWFYPEFI
jgi:hypothetical protein